MIKIKSNTPKIELKLHEMSLTKRALTKEKGKLWNNHKFKTKCRPPKLIELGKIHPKKFMMKTFNFQKSQIKVHKSNIRFEKQAMKRGMMSCMQKREATLYKDRKRIKKNRMKVHKSSVKMELQTDFRGNKPLKTGVKGIKFKPELFSSDILGTRKSRNSNNSGFNWRVTRKSSKESFVRPNRIQNLDMKKIEKVTENLKIVTEELVISRLKLNEVQGFQFMGKYLMELEEGKLDFKNFCTENNVTILFDEFYKSSDNNIYVLKSIDGGVQGLCYFKLDLRSLDKKVMKILHISTMENDDFEIFFEKVVETIFEDYKAEEIWIEIQHLRSPKSHKLKIDKDFKRHIKAMGFKWKMLKNSDDGSRTTVYSVTRNEEIYQKLRPKDFFEPFKLTKIAFETDRRIKKLDFSPFQVTFLTLYYLLKRAEKGASVTRYEDRIANYIENVQERKLDLKLFEEGKTAETIEIEFKMRKLKIKKKMDEIEFFEKDNFRPLDLYSGEHNGYRYLRMSYCDKLISNINKLEIYMIPNLSKQLYFFIIPLENKRLENIKINEIVNTLYKWTPRKRHRSKKDWIWVPEFKFDSGYLKEKIFRKRLFDPSKIKTEKEPLMLNRFKIHLRVRKTRNCAKLEPKIDSDDVLISKEFIFGVLDLNILVDMAMPFFITNVKPGQFFKIPSK